MPSKKTKAIRRSQGLCVCGRMPENGRSSCLRCLDINKKSKKKTYVIAAESNLCVDCKKMLAIDGKSSCQDCLDKNAHRQYLKRKTTGLCITCFKSEPLANRKHCVNCKEQSKISYGKRYQHRLNSSLCVKCAKPTIDSSLCSECAERSKNNNIKLRQARANANLCHICGLFAPLRELKCCAKCQTKLRTDRLKLKEEVFNHYGGFKCNCCGEQTIEFLTIDHVNNDGYRHRLEVGNSVYRDLRKRNYPEGYQVLCMNCNWAKGQFGECPHKKHSPKNLN